MVDLSEIQAAYYMVAATGVLVAAGFYILNLRETTRNRRITLTTTMMQPFITEEGMRWVWGVIDQHWTDLDDYMKKYDSRVNPDNFAKRYALWNLCENLGRLYKEGLIDIKTLQGGTGGMIQYLWIKYKPVIEMYRLSDFGPTGFMDFEYIAGKLVEYEGKLSGLDQTKEIEKVISDHEK